MKKTFQKMLCGAMATVMLLGTAPMAKAATPFTDVSGDSWYVNYVDYAYNHKLMTGTSDTTFSPNQKMTRGMLVTVLHSIAGKPAPAKQSPFSDIGNTWYTNATDWCYEHNIVAGTSDTTFSPNQYVTREQMVVIMRRFAEYKGLDISEHTSLAGYSDSRDISHYAVRSFAWAVAAGIMTGTSETTLSPSDHATRAQCAVVLQRFNEWMETAKPAPVDPEPTDPQPTEPTPTEPSKPVPTDPQPTEPAPHVHKWTKVHHDEVGHWGEEIFYCTVCPWSCTESDAAAAGMDLISYWTIYHQDIEDQKDPSVQHSYEADSVWEVDEPAYDEWVCECGATSETEPVNP